MRLPKVDRGFFAVAAAGAAAFAIQVVVAVWAVVALSVDGHVDARVVLGGAVAALATLGVLVGLLVRAVHGPVRRLTAVAIALASGRVPAPDEAAHARDELGQLSHLLDGLVRLLRDLLGSAQGATRRLDGAAKELVTANVQLADGVRTQAERLHDASGETERMAAALTELATAFQAVSRTVSGNASAAEAGSRAVTASAGALDAIRASGGEVQEAIGATVRASERIGQIVEVLQDIAGETHVLSLNASIEAARAGEQGRGFSVVASEVRALADRAARSAREIREIVAESARHLRAAHEAVQRNGAAVDRGVAEAQGVATAFASIHASAQETDGAVGEMSAVLQDQVEATRRTAALVGEVSRVAEETGTASAAILAQGEALHGVVADLDAILGRFEVAAAPAEGAPSGERGPAPEALAAA